MTASTLKSFAQSTGLAANKSKGQFSGALLGKMAEGLEALDAIKNLAEAKVNRFMELAIQAANVAKQTLEATKTIPFATPDLEFNPTLNIEKAALAPKGPGLGSSAKTPAKRKRKKKSE